jgi:hypothetical protein
LRTRAPYVEPYVRIVSARAGTRYGRSGEIVSSVFNKSPTTIGHFKEKVGRGLRRLPAKNNQGDVIKLGNATGKLMNSL